MAQKVQVVLTCDLDEDEVPAAQTVTFGYQGSNYAFELCKQHLAEVNEVFQAWIEAARARRFGPAPPQRFVVGSRSQSPELRR